MSTLKKLIERTKKRKKSGLIPNYSISHQSYILPTLSPSRNRSCVRLGDVTEERILCNTCKGRVELKVFSCEVHGKCVLSKQGMGVACCSNCVDYKCEQ